MDGRHFGQFVLESVPRARSVQKKKVTVIYPYDGQVKDDLSMKPGDVITVDDWDVSDDWARGTLNGKAGVFYKAFTKLCSAVPSPDNFKLREVRGKPKGYEATYRRREYVLKAKLDEVECIICQEIADNVHQTSCCGSTICFQCAEMWKEKNNSCPQCRKQPLKIVEDPKTQRRITGATVYCPNHRWGCKWVSTFGHVAQHLATDCEFEGMECPNSECNEVFHKKFLEVHLSKLCLWRKEACPCYRTDDIASSEQRSFDISTACYLEESTYYGILYHHRCPSWPTRCPNSCSPYLTLTRSTVGSHVEEECPETVIDCQFAKVGCKVKTRRKDLPQHMQEAISDHVTAMFEDHMKLKQENARLETEVNHLKSRLKQQQNLE